MITHDVDVAGLYTWADLPSGVIVEAISTVSRNSDKECELKCRYMNGDIVYLT